MIHLLTQMLAAMQQELTIIEDHALAASFQLAEQAFQLATIHLLRLKDNLRSVAWNDKQTVLYFFKKIQPAYFAEILFYYKVLRIEEEKPAGSPNHVRLYYKSMIQTARQYVDGHHFLHSYDALQLCYLDEILFDLPPSEITIYPPDENFHYTEYFNFFSYCLSKIKAMERLQKYLNAKYQEQKPPGREPDFSGVIEAGSGYSKRIVRIEAQEIIKKLSWLESSAIAADTFNGYVEQVAKRHGRYRQILQNLSSPNFN